MPALPRCRVAARTTLGFPDPLPQATPSTIGFIRLPFRGAENGRPDARVQVLFAELTSHARSLMVAAALWDVAGALGALPDWWPPVSYVLAAAAIAAACTAALL